MANPYVKQTWTDSVSQTTAARMGVLEDGIYDAHFQPACRVWHTATQTCTTAVDKVLDFDSEHYDQDGLGTSTIHSTSSNISRLVCRVAGVYHIGGNVEFDVNATGNRNAKIRLNGTTIIGYQRTSPNASVGAQVNVNCDWSLAVNDYVELLALQNSGGNLNVNATSHYSPNFWMHRVG